ncbi:hypothetical protein OSH11_03820 [Kaistia dalseonensis]|uniref:Uncharacterized protein n=1 Tax=Kaistia dalseonensis TaxID=410840 RepID=A0ABU0H3M7_9HYPH|nr:hypothetical protein [Kaistia dalseonensis]MCX5493825.1 hypothetical protein [Kaistia dalseonensis]MDQ0436390.1 hypothetical protein [Kaistia dalseonensis]
MSTWFHTTILATCAAATIAVGFASAAVYSDIDAPRAKKADRLIVGVRGDMKMPEITVQQRGEGMSIVTRVPITDTN